MDVKKILLYVGIGVAALLLVVGVSGTMAVVLIKNLSPGVAAPATAAPAEAPAVDKSNLVDLKPFVTNLADKPRYISISFTLVGVDAAATTKLKDGTPIVRDAIISVLNSMTSTEVSDEAGSNTLKTEIMNRLNTDMGGKLVSKVLLTEKVIQH